MTELELSRLGFQCKKQYTHDEFYTNRYTKGVLQVEFTYEGVLGTNGQLKTVDLTITEVNGKPITLEEMEVLTPILGDWVE